MVDVIRQKTSTKENFDFISFLKIFDKIHPEGNVTDFSSFELV